jgi:hypothetical protein
MFARVLESSFQCRGCGLRSPLDTFCLEAEIDCPRCGMTQAFDTEQWIDALNHAHAVADLSGPPPNGQGSLRHGQPLLGDNPYAKLGVEFTFAELQQSGMTISAAGMTQKSLHVKVATGHPVCPAGHGPVLVELDGRGNTRVTCSQCNAPAIYALPPKATEFVAACVGVIDEEHRSDRPRVRVMPSAGGAGAIALTCPACSAALPVAPDSSVVTCQFCKAVSLIPKRTLAKLSPQIKGQPFWLLFRGPSAKRKEIAGEQRPGSAPEDSNDDDSDPPVPAPQGLPSPQDWQAPAAPASSSRWPVFVVLAIVVVLAAGAGFWAFASRHADHSSSPHHSAPGRSR